MSETKTGRYTQVSATQTEPTGWVGWIIFASIMLFLIGTLQVMAGLIALFNDDYYLVTSNGLLVNFDFPAWGWTHLLIGVVCLFAGGGVLSGRMWARIVGIAVAFVSIVVNVAFLYASPVWSVIMITVAGLVIWALSVHGREAQAY